MLISASGIFVYLMKRRNIDGSIEGKKLLIGLLYFLILAGIIGLSLYNFVATEVTVAFVLLALLVLVVKMFVEGEERDRALQKRSKSKGAGGRSEFNRESV